MTIDPRANLFSGVRARLEKSAAETRATTGQAAKNSMEAWAVAQVDSVRQLAEAATSDPAIAAGLSREDQARVTTFRRREARRLAAQEKTPPNGGEAA